MALAARRLNSNKIDRYFFKSLVCVGEFFVILIEYGNKALKLIFYWIFVKRIYSFFVGFLVAVIG